MSLLARLVPPDMSTPDGPPPGDATGRGDPDRQRSGGSPVKAAWRWFAGQLTAYHWWIIAVVGGIAFVLGCVGWWRFEKLGDHSRPSDAAFVAYWSLKDFFLVDNPEVRGIPWELDAARFLAPVVFSWATLSALGLLFRDRVQQMRIPLMRGHVVMCGLGKYVGIVFLRHLREKGIRVVVIEEKASNPNIELCRSIGVPVIIGDAQRLKTLETARARRAWRVLVVTADDATNTQIVATWRELPGRRSRQLCLARITDPDFSSLLRIQEAQRADDLAVDFFNIDEIGARLMLKEFPCVTDDKQPHILVAHVDPLGIWLVYHAARAWHRKRGVSKVPLVVTVLDAEPDQSIKKLTSQHPELKNVCAFKPLRATAEDILEKLPRHHLDSTPHIHRAYVTAYDDKTAFETALRLHNQLHKTDPSVPVVVALSRPHGVANLLRDVKRAGTLPEVDVFPTMQRACTVELVQGGAFEPLAEEIHERWRTTQLADDSPAPSWEDLDESRRESNRAQARDIVAKLHKINCAVAPLQNWDFANDFTFDLAEVEELAIHEHDRWWDDRIADGWRLIPMPVADTEEERKRLVEEAKARKESPYLISWEDLLARYSKTAELDRMFVREIPDLLASVGLRVVRTDEKATLASNPQATPA